MKSLIPVFLFLLGLSLDSAFSQAENPAQKSVQEVNAPAPSNSVRANIVPLFWKANIDESRVSVPIRSIEFFGVQDYDVDGATRVRELTISTDSNNLIRIYHIRPLEAVASRASSTIETLRRVAEGASGEELDLPVKIFPATTHAHMVEYRVSQREDIDTLYGHLEQAMIAYHARDLIDEQKPLTVSEIQIQD